MKLNEKVNNRIKGIFLITIVLIVLGCNKWGATNNKSLIMDIDHAPVNQVIYGMSMDDEFNMIDTISVEKKKFGFDGQLIYKSHYDIENKVLVVKYFRDSLDLFYQTSNFAHFAERSTYETFVTEDNEISTATMISYDSDSTYTINMDFNYVYSDIRKIEKLVINSKVGSMNSVSTSRFDQSEHITDYYLVIENDTIEYSKYEYLNGKLSMLTDTHYNREIKSVTKFNHDENAKWMRSYKLEGDKEILLSSTFFTLDSVGDVQMKEVYNKENDYVEIVKYVKITNP